MTHEQVINGQPPSKSNCYRIIQIAGHGSLCKTKALEEYERDFYLQCGRYRGANIKSYFELYVDVYFSSQRPDLDNAMKTILDCLQACGAIKNDRNCTKIVANKFIDPVRPRIEFTIKEVEGIVVKRSNEPSLFDNL